MRDDVVWLYKAAAAAGLIVGSSGNVSARAAGGMVITPSGGDPETVTAALNAMDVTTFFGRVKFATDAEHHGLQDAHQMVLAQWQQMPDGKLGRQVVWPDAAKSADLMYPIPPATH